MQIIKIFSKFLICILCVFCLHNSSFAAGNIPYGDVGEYGNWITEDNMEKVNTNMSADITAFQDGFEKKYKSNDFVPIETRVGLAFMKALSSIDVVLKTSLVRFTIMFLFVMYAFWIGLEAYKTIRESTDYKKVFYDIFEKGIKIVAWVIILEIGPAKIFTMLMTPILTIGTYLSNFILTAVAQTFNVQIPNTCDAITQYVNTAGGNKMLIDANTAANIMCLPGRLSVFFYHATGTAWKWMIHGFGHSAMEIAVGGLCIVLFIKCIFKFAFMTLGIVADLFLTLLMLPFTALSEALPETSEKNYAARVFNGFLKMFNTKKLSDVIYVFINTAIYFVSLSIIVAICAALLTKVHEMTTTSAMTTVLCACLTLYIAGRTEKIIEDLGGKIDNSFGDKLKNDSKTLWGDIKTFGYSAYKDWMKK